MNSVDVAVTPCLVLEPEHWNTFNSIEVLHAATFKEEPMEAKFWEKRDIPSPWNRYWTDSIRQRSSLDIHKLVFRQHWINCTVLHCFWVTKCDSKESCQCEEHNHVGAQWTVGHPAAADTTAKTRDVPLIVKLPWTSTLSTSNAYDWHW